MCPPDPTLDLVQRVDPHGVEYGGVRVENTGKGVLIQRSVGTPQSQSLRRDLNANDAYRLRPSNGIHSRFRPCVQCVADHLSSCFDCAPRPLASEIANICLADQTDWALEVTLAAEDETDFASGLQLCQPDTHTEGGESRTYASS